MSCASETIALHYGGAVAPFGSFTAVVDSAQRSFSAGGGIKEKEGSEEGSGAAGASAVRASVSSCLPTAHTDHTSRRNMLFASTVSRA